MTLPLDAQPRAATRRRSRRILLALAAVSLPVLVALSIGGMASETEQTTAEETVYKLPPDVAKAMEGRSIPTPVRGSDGKLGERAGDYRLVYTLDPELQAYAERLLAKNKVAYAGFVAVEPSTGRILAMAERPCRDPDYQCFNLRATYPAASLVKVITSAAALATGMVTPASVFTYTGSPYLLSEGKIALNFRPKRPRLATLAEALGQSNNIVFAKVGADVVGQERLLTALNAFGFNRDISFEFPLQQSRADVPLERYPLAQTAAGFGSVRLSPLHAAMIAASVANKGVMMQPYIIETVLDALGQTIFSSAPRTLMQTVPTEIAATLGEMMKNTVTQGTSRRSFLLRAKELVARISVAGKTGSLNGDDPPGRYEWFIGFAPADKPEIAVAALVVNNGSAKHLKGSDTAALMMREHFHL